MKWKIIISRGHHPVLLTDTVIKESYHLCSEIIRKSFGIKYSIKNWKRYEGSSFASEEEWNNIVKALGKKFLKNPKLLKISVDDYYEKNEKTITETRKIIPKNLNKVKLEKLKEIYEKFLSYYNPPWGYCYFPFMIDDSVGKVLDKEIEKRTKKFGKLKKLRWYLQTIKGMPKPTIANKESDELIELAMKIKGDKEFKDDLIKGKTEFILKSKNKLAKDVIKHHKKYSWLQTYLFEIREYSLDEIIEKLINLVNKKRLTKDQQFKKNKENLKILFKDLRFDSYWKELVHGVQLWIWVRAVRVEQWSLAGYLIHPVLEEIGRRYGLSYKEVCQLTKKELLSGKFDKRDIKARKKDYVFLLKDGKGYILTGEEAEKLKEKSNYGEVRTVKGVIANKGKAEGIVRVCNAYTFNKIKEGEIIVTGMTTPEATHFLHRAAAIVTDEGGVTCHAAIVSRELDIPCIIATKIATKVLKTGDKVEVNANKGIVRKIVQKRNSITNVP